jgi:hypothetical protein
LALEDDLRGLLVELLRRHLELFHLVELGTEVAVHRRRLAREHSNIRHGCRSVARLGDPQNLVADWNPVEQIAPIATGLDRQCRSTHRDDRTGKRSAIPGAHDQATDRPQVLGSAAEFEKDEQQTDQNQTDASARRIASPTRKGAIVSSNFWF